jgi:hypothetical protein
VLQRHVRCQRDSALVVSDRSLHCKQLAISTPPFLTILSHGQYEIFVTISMHHQPKHMHHVHHLIIILLVGENVPKEKFKNWAGRGNFFKITLM